MEILKKCNFLACQKSNRFLSKNLIADEKKDAALIKEALEKTDKYDEMARWLTSVWMKKYGAEFRNVMSLEYNLTEETFTLRCGNNVKEYEENELGLISKDIMFFRKQNK